MNKLRLDEKDMPNEIDFGKAVRGLHHIPADAKILMPASIEKSVWQYFQIKRNVREYNFRIC